MQNQDLIIDALEHNKNVFQELLQKLPEQVQTWRPAPEKWSLLEVVCHLHDEEREDFRARVRHTLESPTDPMPPIDPTGWVTERLYSEQNFDDMLDRFLQERDASIQWLRSLSKPNWNNTYEHPKFGSMSAHLFLSNWLAHDYLHIRQIIGLKFGWLKEISGEELDYAGPW